MSFDNLFDITFLSKGLGLCFSLVRNGPPQQANNSSKCHIAMCLCLFSGCENHNETQLNGALFMCCSDEFDEDINKESGESSGDQLPRMFF
jgi:hypothetical protein